MEYSMYVYEPIEALGSSPTDYFHYHEVAHMDSMIKNPRQTLIHMRDYLGPFCNAENQVIAHCLQMVMHPTIVERKGLWASRAYSQT
jgi:hypothetical protein